MIRNPEPFIPKQPFFLTIEMTFERDGFHVMTAEADEVMLMSAGEFERATPTDKPHLANDACFL